MNWDTPSSTGALNTFGVSLLVDISQGHPSAYLAITTRGVEVKKYIAGILSALALTFGLVAVSSPAQAAPVSTEVVQTARFAMTEQGNMVPLNADAEEVVQSGYNPIRSATAYRFNFSSAYGNPERNICIKDYTTTSTGGWNFRWTATDYANASNKFHVVWDNMNGNNGYGESNCISYDGRQTISAYSYGSTTDGYCNTMDIGYSAAHYIVSATVWMNTHSNYTACRYTSNLRQNAAGSAVGNVFSLLYHTNGNVSIMNTSQSMRLATPNPEYSDREALGRAYATS